MKCFSVDLDQTQGFLIIFPPTATDTEPEVCNKQLMSDKEFKNRSEQD